MKRLHKAQVPRNVLLGSAPLVVLLLFFAACGEAMTPVGPEMNAQSDALVAAKGGQPKVAVCHIPPGNPVDRHIITVGERAARAHLAHGDNLLDEVCPAPGVEFNGQCYILGGGDFAQAEQACMDNFCGGHLASIHSQAEDDFVSGLFTIGGFIGGTDSATEGEFVWTDGSPFDFENWLDGEPNDLDNEDCIQFGPDGWNDLKCSTDQNALCKVALP